jgi:glycosyltransferase involved in cell wall biosynthesis
MYEFQAAWVAGRVRADLIHVLYAENYFRFLKFIRDDIPVVLTFHQPADLLESELRTGAAQGRVAALTHRLTRSRFRRADAAIITSESQRGPLAKYIDESRIHHIPLGVSAGELMAIARSIPEPERRQTILTVGNWKRDWLLYFDTVRRCRAERPSWRFVLINRQLASQWMEVIPSLDNLKFLRGVDDLGLHRAYREAAVQFLPVTGASGNNAVNESLAFGCPVVSNMDLGFGESCNDVVVNAGSEQSSIIKALERVLLASESGRADVGARAADMVARRDWSVIAARTLDVYRSVT